MGDILGAAKRGNLRVPRFQTGLRWKAREVEELFDSIVRGFPIGGLLLWKKQAPEESLVFGPVTIQAPALPDARYIVDGQQRVTALVGGLLHPDKSPLGGNYAVWTNLATGEFRVWRNQPPPQWIPVNLFGSRVKLQHWARSANHGQQTAALVDRAFQIEEALVRYEMPAYVVSDATPEALRLIFSRTNSSGVPLREDQVFQALFGGEKTAKPLDIMAGSIEEQTGFGSMSVTWLLRCVKAVGALDPRKSFTEHTPPSAELLVETRNALRLAVSFLQNEVGFVHGSLLPYRFPLIILARFFAIHPTPHPRSRTLLTRWVWRGALGGTHGSSSHAAVRANLDDVGDDEHGSVQRLLSRVPKTSDLPDADTAWFGKAATTRLYATALVLRGPLNPETIEPYSRGELLEWFSERQLGELFRRAMPRTSGAIAARVLVPRGYSIDALRDASEEVLESLCISDEAAIALRQGRAQEFEACRSRTLHALLNTEAAKRAAQHENDRSPMTAIVQAS